MGHPRYCTLQAGHRHTLLSVHYRRRHLLSVIIFERLIIMRDFHNSATSSSTRWVGGVSSPESREHQKVLHLHAMASRCYTLHVMASKCYTLHAMASRCYILHGLARRCYIPTLWLQGARSSRLQSASFKSPRVWSGGVRFPFKPQGRAG